MDDILKLTYSPGRNQTYVDSVKGLGELERFAKSKNLCEYVFGEISSIGGEGIHLDTFLAFTRNALVLSDDASDMLSLIVYPSKGEIGRYDLNPREQFFSNAHMDPDPLVVKGIKMGFHVHSKITEAFIHIGSGGVPNTVKGLILFKKNPFEKLDHYTGFNEFIGGKEINTWCW